MLSNLLLVIAGSFCAFSTPLPYKFISGKDVSNASASWMPANMSCSVFSVYCPMPMFCNETTELCQCCSRVQEQSGRERQSMTFCSLDFWKGRGLYDTCFIRTSSQVQLYCDSKRRTDLYKKAINGRSCVANETCRILRLWNESDPSPPWVEIGCVSDTVAKSEPTVESTVQLTVEPTEELTVGPTIGTAGMIIGVAALALFALALLFLVIKAREKWKKRRLLQIVEYKLQPKPIDLLDGNIPSLVLKIFINLHWEPLEGFPGEQKSMIRFPLM